MTAIADDGTLTIAVTEKAAEKLKHFARRDGLGDEFGVKVGVKGGGCSGLLYTLSVEKEAGPNDKIVDNNGVKVFIVGAGAAAHLAGVVAAHSTLPVIGVPIDSSPLTGWDALLATVQMPPGVPVATVSVGKAGAVNAAVLAAQILALADDRIAAALKAYKARLAEKVERAAAKVEGGSA